jgi:ParB family chromosome partitioning protein
MAAMIHEIKESGLTRDDVRRMKDKEKQPPSRPRGFQFHFRPPDKRFSMNIRFRRSEVSKPEIIQALKDLIEQLSRS